MVGDKVEGLGDIVSEGLVVDDGLVGGCDDDVGVGADAEDVVAGPCHAGGGVAVDGFAQEVVFGQFRQLFHGDGCKVVVDGDEDIFYGYDLCESVESLLQLCSSCAKEVDELFWVVPSAAWPHSFATSSGQYHAEVMVICQHKYYRFFKKGIYPYI